MTEPPYKIGDRFRCFVVVREDRGWGGAYGMTRRPVVWECVDCKTRFRGAGRWDLQRLTQHHECGHAPCARCGQSLLRRKDGTPRQHAHHLCPGKSDGDKIEREFVKNMTAREYA